VTSRLRRFFAILGPGLVTGAADDDPSGVATYAQAGAVYSNGLLWTVPVCLPLMMAVQEICDRTTLASGDSLGALIRRRFSHGVRTVIGVLLTALILANTLNLSADLMAIGQGMKLLGAGPGPVWSVIAGVGIGVAVVAGLFEWIVRVFKWLCMILFVYVAVLFVSHVDWADVAAGLVGARIDVGSAAYWGLRRGARDDDQSVHVLLADSTARRTAASRRKW
jgi:Mn2+/Fe2+ NRAMP family transporter